MEHLGLGSKIAELKNQIRLAKNELSAIKRPEKSSPQLIDSTNLLRENEYLSSVNDTRTQLLELYQRYASELEKMFSMVFEIQNELKDLIKEHAQDIAKPKSKRIKKRPTKKRTKPKKPKRKAKTKRVKSRRK